MTCLTQPGHVKPWRGPADVLHVGSDVTEQPRTTGCPVCGASRRPDAQWCGQCYADFRPPPPPPVPEPAAGPVPDPLVVKPLDPSWGYDAPAVDPLTQPLVELLAAPATPEPTWPCTRCDTPNPLLSTTCSACGSGFLAGLKDTEKPLLVLPVVGDLGAMSRGRRLALAAALVAAVVVPLALLTLLLTKHPDTAPAGGADSTVITTAPATAPTTPPTTLPTAAPTATP